MTRRKSIHVARKTVVDGITFDSKHEAKRYGELKLLKAAGEICDLELQPQFKLGTDEDPVLMRSARYHKGRRVTYTADFQYWDLRRNLVITEDAKGLDTDASRLRRAFTEWQYKIRIELV